MAQSKRVTEVKDPIRSLSGNNFTLLITGRSPVTAGYMDSYVFNPLTPEVMNVGVTGMILLPYDCGGGPLLHHLVSVDRWVAPLTRNS